MNRVICRSTVLMLAVASWIMPGCAETPAKPVVPAVPVVSKAATADEGLHLVPWPKTVQLAQGRMELSADSRIVTTDPKLAPLAEILAGEIYRVSGVQLKTGSGAAKAGDISINFDKALTGEAYKLTVGDMAAIMAGDYQAASWGTVTLLQALAIDGGKISLPKMDVSDDSDMKVRSAETDIARKWCPIENLYELIDLFQFYKLNFIQLHMVDHGMFTFRSELYPELATPKHSYSKQELKDLVAYADARGVTIIPELEMPGHDDAPHILPKIFGSNLKGTGEYPSRGQGIIDIERDETVKACAALLNEVMDVFQSSPYVSIGADEVAGGALTGMYEYPQFQKDHPGVEPLGYFIGQMDDVVKKRGKTLMVFGRGGPDDVLQMPWVGNDNDIAKKYMILPYSTGSVTQFLIEGHAPPYNTAMLYSGFESGYNFDLLKNNKISVANQKKVVGIQILSWQNWHYVFFPDYRKTMASVAENAWNYSNHEHFKPFAQWRDTMWAHTNARLGDEVFPVKVETQGLLSPGKDIVFDKTMTVKLTSALKGTIHYRMEKLNYLDPPALPTMESPVYKEPITVTEPTVIYARLFDENGQPVGFGSERRYYPIEPKVECNEYSVVSVYKAMGYDEDKPRLPKDNSVKPPLPTDPAELHKLDVEPEYTYPLGRLTYAPSYDGFTLGNSLLDMKGQIKVPADSEYHFVLYGFGALSIDGKVVASMALVSTNGKRAVLTQKGGENVQLTAGVHSFEFIGDGASEKVVDFKTADSSVLTPLDTLIVPLEQK